LLICNYASFPNYLCKWILRRGNFVPIFMMFLRKSFVLKTTGVISNKTASISRRGSEM